MSLMTRKEFIRYRDDHALDEMRKRKTKYEKEAAEKLAEAYYYRDEMDKAYSKRDKDLLEIEYDVKMREWAILETGIGSIERDARYIRWLKQEAKNGEK